jgi:diadenosine tetraphosphate (Ap4A) HIT family hydrolase
MNNHCPCCVNTDRMLNSGLAFAVYDTCPVNEGHLLRIPERRYPRVLVSTKEELDAIADVLQQGKALLDGKYKPDGYNIGVNVGTASGQSILHVHIHLIPRFVGDVDEPLGGVRGVIPARQKYPPPR